MALLITVSPAGSGWTVQSAAFDGDVIFASAAKAEAAGRSLADQVAESNAAAADEPSVTRYDANTRGAVTVCRKTPKPPRAA